MEVHFMLAEARWLEPLGFSAVVLQLVCFFEVASLFLGGSDGIRRMRTLR